jgi:hypothetical protein
MQHVMYNQLPMYPTPLTPNLLTLLNVVHGLAWCSALMIMQCSTWFVVPIVHVCDTTQIVGFGIQIA